MGIVANIRGPMGLAAMLVVTFASGKFTVTQANPAISFNTTTGVATFLTAGWYLLDWKAPATNQAANSTLMLSKANHQIAGPLT